MVERGHVIGIDEPALVADLLARTRSALAADATHSGWRATVQALAEDLGLFYAHGNSGGGCCG